VGVRAQQHQKRLEVRQMKVGDLVKLPEDRHYWWGGKAGLVVDIEDKHQNVGWRTLRILVAAHNPGVGHVKFGANFVELINEGR